MKVRSFFFGDKKNFIIWENGKWKTNVLESIILLSWWYSIINLNFENLVKENEDFFYIEYKNKIWILYSLFYDKQKNKRIYSLNWKSINKKKFIEQNQKNVSFSPITINMMYLSPSLRRDFLDTTLISSYTQYEQILKKYKQILKNRNKLLKSIMQWKSDRKNLNFWNKKFIEISNIVYEFRFKFVEFLERNQNDFIKYFWDKVQKIKLEHKTKVSKDNLEKDMEQYLEKNRERDIILWKTQIWPHIDDFDITLDGKSIISFASRWEAKSTIIWLKLLEIKFIEKETWKKPILLIDDLFSELDNKHKDMLLWEIKSYQTFFTAIELEKEKNVIKL